MGFNDEQLGIDGGKSNIRPSYGLEADSLSDFDIDEGFEVGNNLGDSEESGYDYIYFGADGEVIAHSDADDEDMLVLSGDKEDEDDDIYFSLDADDDLDEEDFEYEYSPEDFNDFEEDLDFNASGMVVGEDEDPEYEYVYFGANGEVVDYSEDYEDDLDDEDDDEYYEARGKARRKARRSKRRAKRKARRKARKAKRATRRAKRKKMSRKQRRSSRKAKRLGRRKRLISKIIPKKIKKVRERAKRNLKNKRRRVTSRRRARRKPKISLAKKRAMVRLRRRKGLGSKRNKVALKGKGSESQNKLTSKRVSSKSSIPTQKIKDIEKTKKIAKKNDQEIDDIKGSLDEFQEIYKNNDQEYNNALANLLTKVENNQALMGEIAKNSGLEIESKPIEDKTESFSADADSVYSEEFIGGEKIKDFTSTTKGKIISAGIFAGLIYGAYRLSLSMGWIGKNKTVK